MQARRLADYLVALRFLNAHVLFIHCASKNIARLVLDQTAGLHGRTADYLVALRLPGYFVAR